MKKLVEVDKFDMGMNWRDLDSFEIAGRILIEDRPVKEKWWTGNKLEYALAWREGDKNTEVFPYFWGPGILMIEEIWVGGKK